jgi:hypothetical protein
MIEDISAICFHRAEALAQKYQREFGDESLLINVLVQEGEIYSLKEEKDRVKYPIYIPMRSRLTQAF